MNNLFRLGLRSCLKKVSSPGQVLTKSLKIDSVFTPASSRTLWHMGPASRVGDLAKPAYVSECCRHNHTGLSPSSSEKDLVEFLQGEIAQEKKTLKLKTLPAELDGFVITTDEAELIFTKKTKQEKVTVSMNVNHSVDTEEVGDEGDFAEEMKAKPSFDVEMEKNGKTLCFSCSYTQFEETGDKDAEDNYQITEVSYFEGDFHDKTYSVAADLLDENLYDLFMNILHEKGITKKFIDKVSEIATSHEHSQYINLLENVRKFASAN